MEESCFNLFSGPQESLLGGSGNECEAVLNKKLMTFLGWWREQRVCHEALGHIVRVQGGRTLPSYPQMPQSPLYYMQIFASNHVVAKSHCWYFVSQLNKLKKS